MRKELHQIEEIEAYVLGLMAINDRSGFEKRIASDKGLKQDVETQKQLTQRLRRDQMILALGTAHESWLSSTGPNGHGGNKGGGWFSGKLNTIFVLTLLSVAIWGIWLSLKQQPYQTEEVAQTTTTTAETENFTPQTESANPPYTDSTGSVKMTVSPDCYGIPELELSEITLSTRLHLSLREVYEQKNHEWIVPRTATAPSAVSGHQEQFNVNATEGGSFSTSTGTNITLEPNSLVDAQGESVTGDVKIVYKEYRSKGDMVLSDIPMHWLETEDGETVLNQFSSTGMYSIEAFSDSGQVYLMSGKGRGMTINFTLSDTLNGTNFYYFNPDSKRWEIADEMDMDYSPTPFSKGAMAESQDQVRSKRPERRGFFKRLWEWVKKGSVNGVKDAGLKSVFTETKKKALLTVDVGRVVQSRPKLSLIQSAQISQFGLYNYDKIIGSPDALIINVIPNDTNGELIKDVVQLVVIDFNLNGAYRYYDSQVYLAPNVSYGFWLFDSSGGYYYCSPERFENAKIENSSFYKLEFEDLSSRVESSKDADLIMEPKDLDKSL